MGSRELCGGEKSRQHEDGRIHEHVPLQGGKRGFQSIFEYYRLNGGRALAERILPAELVRLVGGIEGVNAHFFEGDETLVLTDQPIDPKVGSIFIANGFFQVSLLENARDDGLRELVFDHALQDVGGSRIPRGGERRQFPGQIYPGLNPRVNRQVVANIAALAKELGYDLIGTEPSYYHTYKMAETEGLRLDCNPEDTDRSRKAIEGFESACSAEGVKSLRERSWKAEDAGGFREIASNPKMVIDLRFLSSRDKKK